MRRQTFILALLIAALATGTVAAASLDEARAFGTPLSPDLEITAISEIVDHPDTWVGQTVRIEGRVSGVCEKRGCWLELVSPDDDALRVKVEDGVIVFPADAVGRLASAEGEVEILELTPDEYEAWLRHQAEETGDEVDLSTVGDGPHRIVRLRGTGAEIAGP